VRIRGLRDLDTEWHWRNVIRDWDATGLNGAQYCRERGITYSQFRDWRIEIKKRDAEIAEKSEEPMRADKYRGNHQVSMAEATSDSRNCSPTSAKERHWRGLIAESRGSGLSGAEYCRRKGIKYSQFADWQQRIRKIDTAAKRAVQSAMTRQRLAATDKARAQASPGQSERQPSVEFAEVQVVDRQLPRESKSALVTESAPLEIALPCGITLRLRCDCPSDFLASVIAVLENR
jgi:hypothetical protein